MSKVKAYAVLEKDENTGGIVFAKQSIVALREGASQFGGGDIDGWSATRAPWADVYAESGRVPQSIMLENGWNFECHGCGERIDIDWLDDHDLPISGVIGFNTGPNYCCAACEEDDARRRKRVDAARVESLSMLRSILFASLPDVKETGAHAYAIDYNGRAMCEEMSIQFEWPGMKIGPASISMRRGSRTCERIGPLHPIFYCCSGDKDAFEAYAKFVKDERATEAQPS